MAKLIAGDKTYEIEELSLGEHQLLKKRYGCARMDLFDPRDPDHLVGLIVLAELRENPTADVEVIEARVQKITSIDVEDEDEDGDVPLDSPTGSSESQPSASAAD